MAMRFGPVCKSCLGGEAVSDVVTGDIACACGAPAVVYYDPSYSDDWCCDGCYDPESEPDEFAESEARWAELFGVVSA